MRNENYIVVKFNFPSCEFLKQKEYNIKTFEEEILKSTRTGHWLYPEIIDKNDYFKNKGD